MILSGILKKMILSDKDICDLLGAPLWPTAILYFMLLVFFSRRAITLLVFSQYVFFGSVICIWLQIKFKLTRDLFAIA